MQITVNDRSFETTATTLLEVLTEWQAQPPFSVAVNQTFVPRHEHEHYRIASDDRIDVLTPIQGG